MLGIFILAVCEDINVTKTSAYTSFRQRLSKGFEYIKRETTASLKPLAKATLTAAALFGAYSIYSGMNDTSVNNPEENLSLAPYAQIFKGLMVFSATCSKTSLPILVNLLLKSVIIDAQPMRTNLPLNDITLKPGDNFSLNLNQYFTSNDTIDFSATLANFVPIPDWLILTSSSNSLGFYNTSNYFINSLEIIEKKAYVACGYAGFKILDISNLSNIVELGFHNLDSGYARDVKVIGTTAYVAASTGLRILNVTDPKKIIEIDYYQSPWGNSDSISVTLVGKVAYLADGNAGWVILNVYPSVSVYYRCQCDGYVSKFAVGLNYYYILSSGGLSVYDFSFNKKGEYYKYSNDFACALGCLSIRDLAVIGEKVYIVVRSVSEQYYGLKVLNITNPAAITELGSYSVGDIVQIKILGNKAYIGDITYSRIRILDISDPKKIIELFFKEIISVYPVINIVNSLAYITDYQKYSLQVIDLGNWTFSGTPTFNDIGNYSVKITAANFYGQNISEIFQISVTNASKISNTSTPTVTLSFTQSSQSSTSSPTYTKTKKPLTKAATKTISNSISSTTSITKTPIKTIRTRVPTATNLLTKSPSNSVSLVPKITQNPTKTFSMTSSVTSTQTASLTPLQTKRIVIALQTQMPFAPFDNGSEFIINKSYVNNFSIMDNSYAKWTIKVGCPVIGTLITGAIIYKNQGNIVNAWRRLRYNPRFSCLHKFMKDYKRPQTEINLNQPIEFLTQKNNIKTIKAFKSCDNAKNGFDQNLPHWLQYVQSSNTLEIDDFSLPYEDDFGTLFIQAFNKRGIIQEEFELTLSASKYNEKQIKNNDIFLIDTVNNRIEKKDFSNVSIRSCSEPANFD